MERFPKTRAEIESLVLHELQTSENCEGVVAGRWPNWTVAAYKPGTSDNYECELALQGIVPRLQGFYELVQKH